MKELNDELTAICVTNNRQCFIAYHYIYIYHELRGSLISDKT